MKGRKEETPDGGLPPLTMRLLITLRIAFMVLVQVEPQAPSWIGTIGKRMLRAMGRLGARLGLAKHLVRMSSQTLLKYLRIFVAGVSKNNLLALISYIVPEEIDEKMSASRLLLSWNVAFLILGVLHALICTGYYI
eukprot:Rmarinus@m.14594